MVSSYLDPSDYATFGVPNTNSNQVIQASILIDGYLNRQEGLIYSNDGFGNPCYMSSKSPSYTLTSTGTISPGTNVVINTTGGAIMVQVGEVVIVDRSNPTLTEACIVQTVSGNQITLQTVLNSHSSSTLLEFGLTLFEEKQMPAGRPITTLSKWPLLVLLSGRGRYGYGRRNSSGNFAVNEYNLLAAITSFGGPPVWEVFNATLAGIDPNTANVWVPAGVLLAYYTQIQLWYIAGWTYGNLPCEIKQSCANIITNIIQSPVFGNVKSYRAGDTAIENFTSSSIDENTKALLEPYRSRVFV